jgi:hypothetical protein
MSEFIRVRDKETGHHVSILREQYDRDPDVWQELKQDATYADGTPLPAKHKTSVSTEAAKKTGGQTADTEKE